MNTPVMYALCRDCLYLQAGAANACSSCGRGRILSHPALTRLSIAHMDCDAFFAAVEKRDDPSLRDKPVIVGGGQRGVVSTCCYIARLYGVRSAMPMFTALKLCPDAVVIGSNFAKYREAAAMIREKMDALTPLVQPVSIDEAYMDLSGTETAHHAPPAVSLARLAAEIER
jgi:DNA polymerase-4